MRFVGGYPAVNFLAVLVGNGKFRAGQLLHCGQVFLGDFHLDGVIAHNHGCIVQQFPIIPRPEQQGLLGQIVDLGFLQVAAVLVHLLQQTEGDFIRQRVAIGGAGFGQGVGIAQMQPRHAVGRVGRYPAFYNISVSVFNGQSGTGQFLVVGQIALAHPHFGRFVGAGAFQNLHRLAVVGKGDFHGFFVDIIAQRGANFLDDVLAAVGGSVLVGAAAVLLTADGNIAGKVGVPVRIGFGAGSHQLTGGKNKATVCIVNIIGGVQVKHSTGEILAAFQVSFVDADLCLFALVMEFNSVSRNNFLRLVVPRKGHIKGGVRACIAIRRFRFRNVIAAQRQGHADLADGAIVDDTQKIIGRRSTRRGKDGSIGGAVTRRNDRHHIALGVPEGAVSVVIQLTILRVDVLGCRDGVLGTGQRAGFVGEVTAFCLTGHPRVNAVRRRLPAGQHLAGLADGQLAEGFVVGILLTNHQRIHAVFVFITGCLINAVGGNGKIDIVACIGSPRIVIAVGCGGFHNAILAQRQFFGQGQDALGVGVESGDILGQMPVYGVSHAHQLGRAVFHAVVAVIVQIVDLKRRTRQQHGFAGFLVNFGDAQIDFNLLVQNREFLVGIRANNFATLRRCHRAHRAVFVNDHQVRLRLIQILGNGGFDHQIGAVGQALHTDVAGIVAENFRQTVLVGGTGGLPAVALAVFVVARSGQRLVVGGNFGGVDLVSFGNRLSLIGKIPLGMVVVVVLVEVAVQNALQAVGTRLALGELCGFGQIGHQIKGKARVLQLLPVGFAAGRNDFADFHIALGDLVLAFGLGIIAVDVVVSLVHGVVIGKGGFLYIPALVHIGGADIIVVFIAQIAVGKGKRISIIGPAAIQCLALGDGAELVFVHPIGVLPAAACQCRDLPGGCLGAAVHRGAGAGNNKSALTQRNDRAGGALYYIIFAEVQVCEGQPAVLDFCAGYQMVFFEHRQVIRYPLPAVVADGRVPEGIAIGIHDFGIIHNTGYAVRMGDVLGSVEVVHSTVQRGVAVIFNILCSVQVHLGNADLAQGTVVFHYAVRGGGGVAVLVGSFAAVVGVIAAVMVLVHIGNRDSGFHAATGNQLGAALVGCQDVSVVVGIVQPKHGVVGILVDFYIIGTLAQGRACSARVVNVRPVTKISGRGFGFHKDELALIALGVIQRVAHSVIDGIGGAVDDRISAIALALHTVGVVAAGGLVFVGHHIPLIDLILGIGCDLAAGFAVGFLEVDLQTPLVIFHDIVIVGVRGHRNRLAASVRAPVLAESIRYCDFLIAELDASQLRFGRCYSVVDGVLGLTLQFRNGGVAGAVGGRISSLLRGERTNLSIASARCFGNGIVQTPACACIAAVLLIVVIGGMTAGGHRLLSGRIDRPAAAVNAAGFGNGFDLDGRAVHLFLRFQLDLIRADSIGKIKTAAGGLGRCFPAGIVFLHNRFRLRFLLTDLRTDQGNGLPSCATGIIDVGVVTAGGGVGFHAVQQLIGRGKINFRRGAFGKVFDDIHLHIVIN